MAVNIPKLISDSIDYIEENLHEKLSLKEIAQQACMSVSLYCRIFKSIFDITVKDYIIKRRLALAARDLVCTNRSVLYIALEYGYSGYEQFSRAFKKIYQVSPTEYRKKGLYIEVFPKLTLNVLTGGVESMGGLEKEALKKRLSKFNSGFLLNVDIDHFAKLNEKYGRKIGDAVLVKVPERIKETFKEYSLEGDIFRIGADEFIVIIKGQNKETIEEFVKDIIQKLRQPIKCEEKTISVTVSIGITEFSTTLNQEELLSKVSKAMLEAKQKGRNTYKLL